MSNTNLKIRGFQESILDFVNRSELPIEVKRLCLEEILTQVREKSNQELQKEIIQSRTEKQEKLADKNKQQKEDEHGKSGETVQ